jgi:hypothetical protein
LAITLNFRGELDKTLFEQRQGQANRVEAFRQHGLDLVSLLGGQGFADPTGGRPGRVNTLAAQQPDRFLAKLAQANPSPGEVRVLGNQAHQVTLAGFAFHAEEQIRPAEVKEAEGVALHELGPIH